MNSVENPEMAVRLYRKVYSREKNPVVSYHTIRGTWDSNQQLKQDVEKRYPGWIIDQVVLLEK